MLTLLAFLLLPGRSSPQALSWADFSGSPACSFIVEGGSGALFGINGNVDRIIYSSDGGASWSDKGLTGNNIDYLAANPNSTTMILGRWENFYSFYEIMLSTDNGGTWSRIQYNTQVWPGNFMVSDRGEVYALLYPSGLTNYTQLMQYREGIWYLVGNPVSSSSSFYLSAAALDHAGNVFFGTYDQGLFYSTDGGTTWNNRLYQNPGWITAIHVDAMNRIYVGTQPVGTGSNGGVFVSSDTGKTWRSISLFGTYITGLTTDNDGTVYASSLRASGPRTSAGSLYRNVPDTTLWDDISPSHDGFQQIMSTRSGNLLASDPSLTVYRSTDKGKTWLNNTIREKDIFTLTTDDSGDVYAGTLGSGIYKTQGGGINSWKEILFGSTCDYIYSLVRHGGRIFAATDCGIFRTTNRGADWINITSGAFNYPTYSAAVNSSGILFAATTFGVYRSPDSGKTWRTAGLSTQRILQLGIDSGDNLFALTDHAGVYRSSDNGGSWRSMGVVRSDVLTLAINGSDEIFVGENGGVSRSTNHGNSWQVIPVAPVNVFSLAFGGSSTIFAATSGGIYASSDNGDSWNPAGNSGIREDLVLSLTLDAKGSLFAGTYRGSVYKSIHTITGVGPARGLPSATRLDQNYPNPFNPSTFIRYQLSTAGHVMLTVYNILGEKVASLVDSIQMPGEKSVEWKTDGLPSGVYFYKLVAGNFAETKKMLLVR